MRGMLSAFTSTKLDTSWTALHKDDDAWKCRSAIHRWIYIYGYSCMDLIKLIYLFDQGHESYTLITDHWIVTILRKECSVCTLSHWSEPFSPSTSSLLPPGSRDPHPHRLDFSFSTGVQILLLGSRRISSSSNVALWGPTVWSVHGKKPPPGEDLMFLFLYFQGRKCPGRKKRREA